MSARILILMATHNGARFLPAQLESIARQRDADWALHVSDDGSKDATCALVRDFATRHPERDIRLHEGPCRGGQNGAAANFLSLLARPDLPLGPETHVAFADQDDIWLPDKLARALALLQAVGPGPAIHGAQSLHVDMQGRVIGRSRPPGSEVTLPRALLRNPVSGHSLMLDPAGVALVRAALAATGAPEVPFHDWWLALLVLACGGRAVIDPDPVLLYRQHGGNVLGGNRGLRASARRLALVMSGDWGHWIAANLTALETLRRAGALGKAPALTTDTCALLDALAATPQKGPARARTLTRLGLRREGRLHEALVGLAAWSGRV